MTDAVGCDRVGEGLRDLTLADELAEVLRPITAGDYDILGIVGLIVVVSHTSVPSSRLGPQYPEALPRPAGLARQSLAVVDSQACGRELEIGLMHSTSCRCRKGALAQEYPAYGCSG